jgi:hypothetical protein
MAVVVMAVAADDRVLVGQLRAERQLVGHERARDVRPDRPERATDLFRGIRFGVPHVLMRRASFEEQEDARLRLRLAGRRRFGLEFEQPRQGHAADQAGSAQPKRVTTRHSVTAASGFGT